MADDNRDPGGEESDEIAEYHLAEERRPIERQEGANAAKGKGRDDAESKSEAGCHEAQAPVGRLHRKSLKALTYLLRRFAKQPLDAIPQTSKKQYEQHDGPATWDLCLDTAYAALELVWQVGKRGGQRGDMLADRTETRDEVVRDRFIRGIRTGFGGRFFLVLPLQPLLNAGISEQGYEFVHLWGSRCLLASSGRRRRSPMLCRECAVRQRRQEDDDRRQPHRRGPPGGTDDRVTLVHLIGSLSISAIGLGRG